MTSRKHIALITTWFPPKQSVATNRMLAFAGLLAEEHCIEVFALDDHAHTEHLSESLTVHYIRSYSLFDRLRSKQTDAAWLHKVKTGLRVLLGKIQPDPLKSWTKGVAKSLFEHHAKHPFDCLISSYAPQESHLAVLQFKEVFPDVRWIADMRDEMSMNPGISEQQREYYRSLEQRIDRHADAITSVSAPILNDFKRLCPAVKHFEEVRNGFNHTLRNPGAVKNDRFTIGYFGSFYGNRKPVTFFKALEQLKNKVPEFDFRFHVVGAHRNFDIPGSLEHTVAFEPSLYYEDAIRRMMEMDLLVVIHPRSGQKGVFTGKLFDYISSGVPVMACVDTDDVAADLVHEMNAGYVAECDDVEANLQALEMAFSDWQKGIRRIAREEQRMELHRSNQVEKLNRLIGTLCS